MGMFLRRLALPGFVSAFWAIGLPAQESGAGASLNVYLDCQTWGCDHDFFRTEIDWVNWVRDRNVADVHILLTAQETGAGGRQFQLNFIGLRAFGAVADTMGVSTGPTATEDDRRRSLAQRLRVGLLRYASRTTLIDRIQVTLPPATDEAAPAAADAQDDPWNFWVFRVGLNGNVNGESRSSFGRVSGSFSASRITDEWKFTLRTNGSYNENTFELSDGEEVVTIRRSYGADGLLAKDLGAQWSGGILASASSSTFSNYDVVFRVAPAVEYNVYPYAESTRRQLTLRYSIGPRHLNYEEETLYGKLSDNVVEQLLEAELQTRQPWGSISAGASASHYLGWEAAPGTVAELDVDGARYSLGLSGGVQLRIMKGLSFNMDGFYSKVRNQIGLRRGEASDEDILLRIRELDTDYNFFAAIGLSYTFGSIYNNVVNPRFSGGSTFFF